MQRLVLTILIISISLSLLLTGCVQSSFCGDGVCGVGEDETNCSVLGGGDCPKDYNKNVINLKGQYSGFYNFPLSFFDSSNLSPSEVLKGIDAQYLALSDLHSNVVPYTFAKIEYDENAYGSTTPEGIKLGEYAKPKLNNGYQRWEVMAHEQGHNFFGGTSSFYNIISNGGPFIQESFSVVSAFYANHYVLDKNSNLSEKILTDMKYDFANGRNYQKQKYGEYMDSNRDFNILDVKTSQALSFEMILLGEKYGWNKFKRVAENFSEKNNELFDFQKDGVTSEEQSTYIIASLSSAFGIDVRNDFNNLNFPVDQKLYFEIYSKLVNQIEYLDYPDLELLELQISKNFVYQNGVANPICGEFDLNWCSVENSTAIGDGPFEFNWGDGSVNCSWFPQDHNYLISKDYNIKVRAKNTCGLISQKELIVAIENIDANNSTNTDITFCETLNDCSYRIFTGGCYNTEVVNQNLKNAESTGMHIGEAPPIDGNVTCTCEQNKCVTHIQNDLNGTRR